MIADSRVDDTRLDDSGAAVMPAGGPFTPTVELMEALAEFAAGAGHEINNPLATILGRAQQLARSETDPERKQSLAIIAAQAYRIRDMISDVMAFARPPLPQWDSFDLAALLRDVATQFAADSPPIPSLGHPGNRHPGASHDRSVHVEAPAELQTTGDREQLAIVIQELLRNARDAVARAVPPPSPGTAVIECHLAVDPTSWQLTVADRGVGFTALEQQHAFHPFYSGRQAGRGLGFGLCKVWQIVQQHQGHIQLFSEPGQTRFVVQIPRSATIVTAP